MPPFLPEGPGIGVFRNDLQTQGMRFPHPS
jgi:hypothetical protein